MVRGFCTRSCGHGHFASERVLAFKFLSFPSPLVPWHGEGAGSVTLVQVKPEVKLFSSVQASLLAWLAILVCHLWKAAQHLVRNRLGPVWAGSAVTQGPFCPLLESTFILQRLLSHLKAETGLELTWQDLKQNTGTLIPISKSLSWHTFLFYYTGHRIRFSLIGNKYILQHLLWRG